MSSEPHLCNACAAELKPRFEAVLDPQTREPCEIRACPECGLGHTLPQPADLGRYYGAAYHGGRHGFTATYCTWRRMRQVTRIAGEGTGKKLLDVGCGDGTFLLAAREKRWSVVGTEMNPEIARAAGLEVRESLEAFATDPPFDCVTFWHSLEHVRDPKGMLAAASRLLAPGGTLFVAVPDAEGVQARVFGARWFHLDVPRHLFHFGERSLQRLLESSGLEVVSRWHQELEIDLFGWTQSALNAVMPDPNVFFYQLTGRKVSGGRAQLAASFVLGSLFTAMALPAVPACSVAGEGGTLVMAARRK
jgi:SAM-dependent methyltransferase